MPPPGNSKAKNKKGHSKAKQQPATPVVPPVQVECNTLEEDEIERCSRPIEHSGRCRLHHSQYCKLTQKYKEASKAVDQILSNGIPSKESINKYKDIDRTKKAAGQIRRYLEALRVERMGRDLHHRRFFLKVDEGHKIRLKLLAKQMIAATETLERIERKAFELYAASNPDFKATTNFLPTALDMDSVFVPEALSTAEQIAGTTDSWSSIPLNAFSEEDDLIDMILRAQTSERLRFFEPFFEHEGSFYSEVHKFRESLVGQSAAGKRLALITFNVSCQVARRIVFYEPVLFMKSLGKVSFKDFALGDNLSIEDLVRFAILFEKRLEFGLLWWKDAVLEAIEMADRPRGWMNVGSYSNRISILGGWIFNKSHTTKQLSNEGWYILLKILNPPASIENRFMRLCNSFEDIHTFLSFAAFGFVGPPSWCDESIRELRSHLSLCGVLVADVVGVLTGVPTTQPRDFRSKKPGCVSWCELQSNTYMFGAVDTETESHPNLFLKEIRSRPDLFRLITRSDNDPEKVVETFGGTEGEVLSQMRMRTFDAPLQSPPSENSAERGKWTVIRSAYDVLYGRKNSEVPLDGYLTNLTKGRNDGQFFWFKKFPVKYFVIIDAEPRRSKFDLVNKVSWAAIRASGFGNGEYTVERYKKASQALCEKHATERFVSWMPKELY